MRAPKLRGGGIYGACTKYFPFLALAAFLLLNFMFIYNNNETQTATHNSQEETIKESLRRQENYLSDELKKKNGS